MNHWELLMEGVRSLSVFEHEYKRVFEAAGGNVRADEMLATLQACQDAMDGNDARDFLADLYGEAKAKDLIAAARAVQDRRHKLNTARWNLAKLIQEQAREHERSKKNA
ncbi:MAG: hypothetical protein AB7K24_20625 [Gemmataceae bacterium]